MEDKSKRDDIHKYITKIILKDESILLDLSKIQNRFQNKYDLREVI